MKTLVGTPDFPEWEPEFNLAGYQPLSVELPAKKIAALANFADLDSIKPEGHFSLSAELKGAVFGRVALGNSDILLN